MAQHNDNRLAPPPDWGRLARIIRRQTGEHLSEEQVMKRLGNWDSPKPSPPRPASRKAPLRGGGGPAPLRASRPEDRSSAGSSNCRSCGSSLAGRKESLTTKETNGKLIETAVYRCRCGKGRQVKREVTKPKPAKRISLPTCASCDEETNFPSETGLCVTCEPVLEAPDPLAPPCFTADYLHARPLGEWMRRTGREEQLKAISKVHSNRISAWVARGGRASERTADELMVALGEHPRAIPAQFWIVAPVAQLPLLESREELAEMMAEAA